MTKLQIVSASGTHNTPQTFDAAKTVAESLVQHGESWAEVHLGDKIVFATDASACSCCCGG